MRDVLAGDLSKVVPEYSDKGAGYASDRTGGPWRLTES